MRLCHFIGAACFYIDVQAATLTWDANGSTAPNPADGNGNWMATGVGGTEVRIRTGGRNDAVFGIGHRFRPASIL